MTRSDIPHGAPGTPDVTQYLGRKGAYAHVAAGRSCAQQLLQHSAVHPVPTDISGSHNSSLVPDTIFTVKACGIFSGQRQLLSPSTKLKFVRPKKAKLRCRMTQQRRRLYVGSTTCPRKPVKRNIKQ